MALERITTVVDTRELGHVKLWIDDLHAMLTALDEVAGIRTVVVDGDYSISAAGDLAGLDETRAESVVVHGADNATRLTLGRRSAVLTVEAPTPAHRGMAAEIERIARQARRPFLSWRPVAVAFLACASVLWLLDTQIDWADPGDRVGAYAAVAAALAVLVAAFVRVDASERARSSAIVIARTRRDAPPWLRRNRDALITNAVVSAAFVALGLVTGLAN